MQEALLSLMLACILYAATPIYEIAAADTTMPVETLASVEEDAPVIAEGEPSTTESQNTVGGYVKREHEHMQEYISWSQAQ